MSPTSRVRREPATRATDGRRTRELVGPRRSERRSRGNDGMKPLRAVRENGGTIEWRTMRRSRQIREAKVMTAQARIAVGYYDRADVKEMLLDVLLQELATH